MAAAVAGEMPDGPNYRSGKPRATSISGGMWTKRPNPGKRFEFNYDFCKGRGICAVECPCGAIEMAPETI